MAEEVKGDLADMLAKMADKETKAAVLGFTPHDTSRGCNARIGYEISCRKYHNRTGGSISMKIDMVPVGKDEKEILRNLLEKYDYEFSQYDLRDVNPLGLYGYSYLDNYWTEEKRWAFFILVNGNLAGFAMVNNYPEAREETDFSMAEFSVLYKYRRFGVGRYAVKQLFDMFKGRWQVKRHPNNIGSILFWDSVIGEYTKGKFRLVKSYPGSDYEDGTLGDIFFFET